jgi:murein DD-endopeptidase MepM/ murein hydrolase activator NlpD
VQIIVVDQRLARALTLTLNLRHLFIALSAITFAVVLLSGTFSLLTVRAAAAFQIPLVSDLISFVTRDQTERNDQFMRDNVMALAVKLGEVQAQLLRLDVMGERVAKVAGIRPEEFRFRDLPGRGGALPGADAMTLRDVDVELQRLVQSVDQRADFMAVLEGEMASREVRRALLPQSRPVADGFIGSGFGWRNDPFTGQMARHEGIDFAAPAGTPIHAAAGGVVIAARYHPIWGNYVEIDHGNALMTRYAHASRLHVKLGDIAKRGQKLAEVGSTGRSTGPHLHFEVHHRGIAQNPSKFLLGRDSPLQAASASRVDIKALAEAVVSRP